MSVARTHPYAAVEALRSENDIVYSKPMSTNWLLGIWRLMRADASLDFAPGVRMEFLIDGVLRYHVDVGGQDQVVDLVYRVDGDLLHTENPEAPHSMSVRIEHGAGDVLLLDFGGAQAMLVREVERPAHDIQ